MQMLKVYRQFNREVWFLTSVTFLTRLVTFLLVPFLIVFLGRKEMSVTQIGWITGSSWVVGAFAGPLIGYLSDRFGYRRIYTCLMLVWTLSFFGFWLAKGFWSYLFISLLNGLGRTCMDSILLTRLFGLVKEEEKSAVFNLNYIAINGGAMIGPFIGTLVSRFFGAELFWIVGLLFTILLLIEPLFRMASHRDLSEGAPALLKTLRILGRDRALRWYVIAGIIFGILYIQLEFALPVALKGENHFTWYPAFVLLNAIVAVVLSTPLLTWQQKYSWKVVGIVISLLFAIGFLCYLPGWIPMYFIGLILIGCGEVIFYPLWRTAISELNPAMRGTYLGVTNFQYLGFALGSIMGGSLYDQTGKAITFLVFANLSILLSISFIRGYSLSQKASRSSIDTENDSNVIS